MTRREIERMSESATRVLRTWTGRGRFRYSVSVKEGVRIEYGRGFKYAAHISARHFRDLLDHFSGRAVKIGTSRTTAPPDSVGEWLGAEVTKTALASYVGPILVGEHYATRVGGSTIRFKPQPVDRRNLIIPLDNLSRESLSVLELKRGRIILTSDLPTEYQQELRRFKCRSEHALEIEPVVGEKPRRTLDRALTVFKLFKDNVVLSKLLLFNEKHDILPHYTHWVLGDSRVIPYHIHSSEETEFQKFWSDFIEISPANFAARRFHLADFRPYGPDRFVDYIEALEYLLVPKSGEGEISFRFRLTGTLILGKDKSHDERKQMFNDLRAAYDLRSAIVHGDQKKTDKHMRSKTWKDVIPPIRRLTREAIQYFHREGCLDNDDDRKQLLERKLIFDSQPG